MSRCWGSPHSCSVSGAIYLPAQTNRQPARPRPPLHPGKATPSPVWHWPAIWSYLHIEDAVFSGATWTLSLRNFLWTCITQVQSTFATLNRHIHRENENAPFWKWRHFLSSRVLVSDNCKQLITVWFFTVNILLILFLSLIEHTNGKIVLQRQTVHADVSWVRTCAKSVISSYPDKGWKSSTVKKVCSQVDHTGWVILHKPGSRRPATGFSFYGWILKTWRVKKRWVLEEKLMPFDEIYVDMYCQQISKISSKNT